MGDFQSTGPSVAVWDSRRGSPSQVFDAFRDAVCSAFMPWTPERSERGRDFEGRIESVAFDDASVGLCRTRGLVARKTATDIARSPVESLYANYVISGEISLEQAGKRMVAKAGDLILYQSHKPIIFVEKENEEDVNLAFSIPLSSFASEQTVRLTDITAKVEAHDIPGPLAGCFHMLAGGMLRSSGDERAAVFAACVALFPLAVRGDHCRSPHNCWSRDDLLRFIEGSLHEIRLTPRWVAAQTGVSARKVHRIFALQGITFSAYVQARRLDRVRIDLMDGSHRSSISEIAFRWGFVDLSTFGRAFKRRFGHAPRELRR